MAQGPHDVNLLDEALFPLILTVGSFLGKCFDGVVFPSLQLFGQVDRGKVPLPDFLLGLELLVEASLVEFSSEQFPDGLKISLCLELILDSFLLLFEVDGGRRSGKAELEVEVEGHGDFLLGGSLDEAVLVEVDGDLFGRAAG